MMIKTKSIFSQPEEDDGLRILITRFYPRGVKSDHFDYWVRELSPSSELLASYKNDNCSFDDFKMQFLKEIKNNLESLEALHALNFESKVQNITLLCYEKQGNPCHRHFVRDLVEKPQLLTSFFEPIDTNYHEGTPVTKEITN
jgi:uncharacterized protein YeaO (DUF488 family)